MTTGLDNESMRNADIEDSVNSNAHSCSSKEQPYSMWKDVSHLQFVPPSAQHSAILYI